MAPGPQPDWDRHRHTIRQHIDHLADALRHGLSPVGTVPCVEVGAGRDLRYTGTVVAALDVGDANSRVAVTLVDPVFSAADVPFVGSTPGGLLARCVKPFGGTWQDYVQVHGPVGVFARAWAIQVLPLLDTLALDAFFRTMHDALAPGGRLLCIHEPHDRVTDHARWGDLSLQDRDAREYITRARTQGLDLVAFCTAPAHATEDGRPVDDGCEMAGMVFRRP